MLWQRDILRRIHTLTRHTHKRTHTHGRGTFSGASTPSAERTSSPRAPSTRKEKKKCEERDCYARQHGRWASVEVLESQQIDKQEADHVKEGYQGAKSPLSGRSFSEKENYL